MKNSEILEDLRTFPTETLISLAEDMQGEYVKDDSLVRKLCIKYYGFENVQSFLYLQTHLLPILAERLMYSKENTKTLDGQGNDADNPYVSINSKFQRNHKVKGYVPDSDMDAYMETEKNIVSIETAKTLCELGYDFPTLEFWDYTNKVGSFELYKNCGDMVYDVRRFHPPLYNWNSRDGFVSLPKLCEVQTWLTIKYNLNINIYHIPFCQKYRYTVTSGYDASNDGVVGHGFRKFDSFNEALISAIEECLEHIMQGGTGEPF